MQLQENQYKALKWFVAIAMPALATLVGTVGTSLGWQYTDLTLTILTAVTTFLGALLGVSNKNYYSDEDDGE